jgi:GT2 family glycosyltransferase
MQILVLGMHRSGTSVLARLLNMIGLYFAPEGVSTGANQENPKRFWERRDVRQANDRLLHAAGADWDMVGSFSIDKIPAEEIEQAQREMRSIVLELDAHRPWFIREPRLCLLFPVWRPLLEMPVCIHIHRHPLEVALSLRERNGFSIPLGLALWERYTLAAFAATAGTPRILVQHAALLRSPVEAVQSIAEQLVEFGVRGLRRPAEAEINAFIQPSLHHHRAGGSSGAQDYLLKNHRKLAKLIESGTILELAPTKLPKLPPYSLDLLKAHDASGEKLAELKDRMRESQAKIGRLEQSIREKEMALLREKIAVLETRLEQREAKIQQQLEKADALQEVMERLDRQIEEQREKAFFLQWERNRQIAMLEKNAEDQQSQWQKQVEKFNKWSERISGDFRRLLESNRWHLGCWLSLKPAGSQSKEAQRFAKLEATRPQFLTSRRQPDQVHTRVGPAARPPALKADVIVCVHNALEDVRRCLDSIVTHRTAKLNKLIVVNDGSDEETTQYLRHFAEQTQIKTELLRESRPTGYTKAANRGLAAREAEYVILLNSDTIVTPGWIDRLIACGESDPSIGIIGPLSNAASWQSVPERYELNGDWAVNELPLSSLDRISTVLSILHTPQYPRVPLVNGFCFVIKNPVIEALGMLDEQLFPNGYGEENDYCLRAGKAGFSPAIADNCYLFHAKSRSYSHGKRRELARQSQLVLHQKYGADLDKATDVLKNSPELARARSIFARLVEAPPSSILFLMNFRAAGGGVNSIVQEANGLRQLGAAVQVAIRAMDEGYYHERFPGVAPNLFHGSEDTSELIGHARSFEFVVATHFKTVRLLKIILEQAPEVIPCYYVQDYEPNFFRPSDSNYWEAVESYTLIPEVRCFAKTRWLCETIAQKHDMHVYKVEPSIDREIFFPDDRPKPSSPFVVCAMVRPDSEHRSPSLTFEILGQIKREFGEHVEIRMFGLERDDPFLDRHPSDFEYEVIGILNREGVAKLMRESCLFIDASTYQAFGRTGLEAMACRCATILPSRGGVSEYAVDGVNTLLAAADDGGDVLRKVRRYLEEPQLYRSIIEEGLKTVSRYSIEGACRSEFEFFESLRRDDGR